MYESHFGLRQRPFRPLADSAYYYPATSHERALSQLIQAVSDDEGCALLTGAPGLGKTVLGHCFLDRLGEEIASAFLTYSHFGDRASLLQAILYDFSLPHEGRSEQELRLALTEFLLKNYEAGRRTVLVIDEAHHLSADLLEELRLLGNLEGRLGKAFQVVLLAQPGILNLLPSPELAAFSQRLAIRAALEPLDLHESADYLVHHLRAAGARPEKVVADDALEILARGAQGVPRLLNRATHQALTLAYVAGAEVLDAEAALEALSLLGLSESSVPASRDEPLSLLEEQQEAGIQEARENAEAEPAHLLAEDSGRERNELSRAHRIIAAPRRPA